MHRHRERSVTLAKNCVWYTRRKGCLQSHEKVFTVTGKRVYNRMKKCPQLQEMVFTISRKINYSFKKRKKKKKRGALTMTRNSLEVHVLKVHLQLISWKDIYNGRGTATNPEASSLHFLTQQQSRSTMLGSEAFPRNPEMSQSTCKWEDWRRIITNMQFFS